jgi:hypothetical protein
MGKWKVSLRVPVLVEVEVYAEDEEEAADAALREADFQNGEEDGVWDIVEAEQTEGGDEDDE